MAENGSGGWHDVATMDELDEDLPTAVSVGDTMIALYLVDGDVFATSDVCTHEFAQLSDGFVEDGVIECPLHQARFDCRTGACLAGPAEADVQTFPVKVEDGRVLVQVEVEEG